MPKVTVEVTAADIREGDPRDCFVCPVALAIQRAIPDYHISVMNKYIRIGKLASTFSFRTTTSITAPESVQEFVKNFDSPYGLPAKAKAVPFSFELEYKE